MEFLNQEINMKVWQLIVTFLVIDGIYSFLRGFFVAMYKDIFIENN